MINVQAICGFGVGSSTLLRIKLQKVFDELGVEAKVTTNDVTSATGNDCDVIFTSEELGEMLKQRVKIPVIIIKNFVDSNEIKTKVTEYLENRTEV